MTDDRLPPLPALRPPEAHPDAAPAARPTSEAPRAEPISLKPAGAPLTARSTAAWGMVAPEEEAEPVQHTGSWGTVPAPEPTPQPRRAVRSPSPLPPVAAVPGRRPKVGSLLDAELLDSALFDPDVLEPALDDDLLASLGVPERPTPPTPEAAATPRRFVPPEPPAGLGSLVLLPPPASPAGTPADVERAAELAPRRVSPEPAARRAPPLPRGPTDARIAKPRRRWLRVLVVVLIILVLLAAAALIFLRPIAERLVAAKVESVAAARGLDVKWASVQFGGPRTVRLVDVTVGSPVGEVRAAAIEVRVDWSDVFKPTPAEVLIEQPTGALHLPDRPLTPRSEAAEPGNSPARPRPPIKITGGRFTFAHPQGEATVAVHEATYAEGVLEGRIELNASRPASGGGALTAQGIFGVRAWRDDAGRFNAEVGNPGDNRALVITHPRHGQLELTRGYVRDLQLENGRPVSGEAEITGLRGRLDGLPALDARLDLAAVNLELRDGEPSLLHLQGGAIRLTLQPDDGGAALDLAALGEPPGDGTGQPEGTPGETPGQPGETPGETPGPAARPPGKVATAAATRPATANPFEPSPLQKRLARLSARALALDLPPIVVTDLAVTLDTKARGGDRLNLRFDHAHYAAGAFTAHGDLKGHEGSAGRFAVHASHAPPEGPRRLGETVLAVWLTAAPLDLALLPREPGRRFITAAGVVDGTLLVHGDPADELAVVADLAVRDGRMGYPIFEPTPIDGIAGRLHLDGRFAPGHLRVDRFVAGHGALKVRAHGQYIDAAPKGRLVLKAVVDPVDCQAALDALPKALLAPYTRIKATGTWAPQIALTLPFADPNGLRFDIKDLVGQCVFTEMRARLPRVPEIKVGGKMAVRTDVTWLLEPFVFRVTEGVSENATIEVGPGTASYVPLGQLPRYVGGAAYLTEEMNFWYGAALSPQLTSKAIATDLAGDRFVYGGSTVTQQLVKNLFLNRDKTLLRKFREAIIAGRVVDAIPKERVLELYLNCIEFGPDLFGIGNASRFYFQKHASQLSIREAIFLAMLKPSPRGGASFKRRGTEPMFPWWTRRVHQVIDRLAEASLITAEEAEQARHGQLRWTADGTYLPPSPDDPLLEPTTRKRDRAPRRRAAPAPPVREGDESKEI